VLQCVAVCCSVLQCVAVFQNVATYCNTMHEKLQSGSLENLQNVLATQCNLKIQLLFLLSKIKKLEILNVL